MKITNKKTLKILLISSEQKFHDSVKEFSGEFEQMISEIKWETSADNALEAIKLNNYDVCLLDYSFDESPEKFDFLHKIVSLNSRKPIILLIDEKDEKLSLKALHSGASHCLGKGDLDASLLEQTIDYVLEYGGSFFKLNNTTVKFRDLIETLPVMIFVVEPELPYEPVYMSPALEVFGYSLEEWKSDRELRLQITHPADRERVFAEIASMMEAGKNVDVEYRIITKSGEVRWIHNTGCFVRDDKGKPIYWQGAVIDITSRKEDLQKLERSEKLYHNLIEKGLGLFCTHDLEGKLLSVNLATAELLGYTKEELISKYLSDFVPPDAVMLMQTYLKRIKADGEYTNSFRIVTKNGEERTLRFSNVIYEENEDLSFVVGNAQDITELENAEKEFRGLFQAMSDLIMVLDKNGRYLKIAPTGGAAKLYRPVEEIIGKTIHEIIPVGKADRFLKYIQTTLESRQPQRLEYSLPIAGRKVWFVATAAPMTDDTIVVVIRDITEQKNAREALVISEEKYRLLGEGIMHQVWTATPKGRIDYVNQRTLNYFGESAEELLGDSWQNVIHPADLNHCLEKWNYSLDTGEDYEVEFRLRRYDGNYCWFQGRATAGRDLKGNIINWFGTNTDINDRKQAEEKLTHLVGHDTLTNLPNRSKFMDHLERAIKRANINSAFRFAVLFLDLDRFKVINDSLGHSTGNKLLIEIAKRLESCVRPSDTVARLSGDEFAILLTHIHSSSDVINIADRCLAQISAPFKLDTYEVFTSASIGLIFSDELNRQPEDFLRDADTAMYRAKAAGKNRYEVFDREMHIRNMNLLQVENDLRKALERSEFQAFYQPIIELETGAVTEFEALIRWFHPEHGLVSPDEFIGVAEETGLIISIGRWILEESCLQIAEWQKRFPAHKNLAVSVNLSTKQLMHPQLVSQVSEILAKTGLDSNCLHLEVTETMVVEYSEKALSIISELNKLGISLSMDDFGTGYSSLSYLHHFPFNRLKIDRSFVSKMDSDQKSEAIVRTILLLAQNLNIEIVAEGIETESQLSILRELGCQTGQGFLFSKPVNAESAAQLLEFGLR